jgi:very-short-patch-repair endonuclease
MNQLLNNARRMRHQPTEAEAKIWRLLKGRQLGSHKFRRQVPMGPYILDFICFETKLVIEIDGGQHAGESSTRQDWLEGQDYRVLRFWNNEVMGNIEGVRRVIVEALEG